MEPEEVELNGKQKAKVLLRAIDEALPWRTALGYGAVVTANRLFVIPLIFPKQDAFIDIVGAFLILPIAEAVIVGMALVILAGAYDSIKKVYDREKIKMAKEILKNVDKEILK